MLWEVRVTARSVSGEQGGRGAARAPKLLSQAPPSPSTPPPPPKPLCDLLTVTAGKVEPHPGSCHQPSLYGSKDRLGHQAPAAGLAGGSALPGRPQRRKAVPQGFRRPDGPGSQRCISWGSQPYVCPAGVTRGCTH